MGVASPPTVPHASIVIQPHLAESPGDAVVAAVTVEDGGLDFVGATDFTQYITVSQLSTNVRFMLTIGKDCSGPIIRPILAGLRQIHGLHPWLC